MLRSTDAARHTVVAVCLMHATWNAHSQDVQLYVTFCLVHILRLHAPDSPFSEHQLQVTTLPSRPVFAHGPLD